MRTLIVILMCNLLFFSCEVPVDLTDEEAQRYRQDKLILLSVGTYFEEYQYTTDQGTLSEIQESSDAGEILLEDKDGISMSAIGKSLEVTGTISYTVYNDTFNKYDSRTNQAIIQFVVPGNEQVREGNHWNTLIKIASIKDNERLHSIDEINLKLATERDKNPLTNETVYSKNITYSDSAPFWEYEDTINAYLEYEPTNLKPKIYSSTATYFYINDPMRDVGLGTVLIYQYQWDLDGTIILKEEK